MRGFIKLHRKILENPILTKSTEYYAVWNYLLLMAAHAEHDSVFGGQRITLKPGQLITGRKKIANFWHISESKVQRILKVLENEQQIEQRTDRQCRLITIVNWEQYQKSEQRIEQRVNNDRTTSEQRVNTIQEYKEYKECNNNSYSWRSRPVTIDLEREVEFYDDYEATN